MTVLGKVPKPVNLPSQRYLLPAELSSSQFTVLLCLSPKIPYLTWLFKVRKSW